MVEIRHSHTKAPLAAAVAASASASASPASGRRRRAAFRRTSIIQVLAAACLLALASRWQIARLKSVLVGLSASYAPLWDLDEDCAWTKKSIRSPPFRRLLTAGNANAAAPPPPSLAEMVALAKAEYALRNPLKDGYPDAIARCETHVTTFHNVFVKQSFLAHLFKIDVPENFLHTLLGTGTTGGGGSTTIVDVGANAGQFALPLAKKGHTIYSFEPVSQTCATLKDNIKKEGVEARIKVACVGVDDKGSTKHFGYVGKRDPGSTAYGLVDPNLPDAHVLSKVQTGPLHLFMEEEAMRRVRILKTDTQGNEEAVLRGARELLKGTNHPRFLVVEFSHFLLKRAGTKEPKTILELIYSAGYVCTHLSYHHPISKEDGVFKFNVVDVPQFMNDTRSISVTFQEVQRSVENHGKWQSSGQLIGETQDFPGWTDLLCFG
mmetsp:Transcript_34981/g.104341  ORF Transcript_34981/g.104341 Transcript_34981/m.104341 type:complete len:435 (-) Transcript_34981:317-1621(-)